jgi:uncharacterized protein (DUF111 family)
MLRREIERVSTALGEVRVKRTYYGTRILTSKPEYEDMKACAERNGLALREVYERLSF